MTSEKFFFYASNNRAYYYDSHQRVFSQHGALVYDNSLGSQSKEYSGPSFHIDGQLYRFELEALFSNNAGGAPYRVGTWQSELEMPESLELASVVTIDTDGHDSTPQINAEANPSGLMSNSLQIPQFGNSITWSPAPSIKSSTVSTTPHQSESPATHTLFGTPASSATGNPMGHELIQTQQMAMTVWSTRKHNKEHRRCPYCHKTFGRSNTLQDHINTHTGEKPHICPFEGCNTGFASKANMKRHFLTHRVGVLEKYRADAASQLSVTRLPGTLGSGETYRVPNSSYDPEAFPNGRLRNSATESIDPIEKSGRSHPEVLPRTSHQYFPESGFGGSDMVLLGADAERKGSETPTLERVPLVLPSESVEQEAREAEEKPPACLASLPEPAQLLPINSGNNNKYYFYASGCFYYFDDHWRLYSDGGTLVYDGSSFQRDSYTTPTFNIDGLPCWFNLGGLFSRDADGAEYNVHTWQSNPETISRHMEMFHHLLCHGCVNFSSQMDAQQENAMIVNGGGFGDIWLGRLSDGTQVAIKAWRASVIEQCDYKTLKRATREIYYWSKLKHENIHQLMGVIMFKGQYLGMVSQWMENGNLCAYMRKNPNFDRCKMSVRVASGLVYMHHRNAVHGDLRASNILVSLDGDPKLTDFGLSTMSEAGLAFSETTNAQAGSTRWASPEQLLEGSPSSKPSDVYALGMTILEIFTGEVPYYPQCRKDFQVMSKLQQGVLPTRPTEQLKDDAYGNRIWELLVKCWNREPDNRPTAMEVFESLNAIYPTQHV